MTKPIDTSSQNNSAAVENLADAEAPVEATATIPEPTPQERIAALEAENEQLKADFLRALADAQNVRRLADKRIEDNSKYAIANFAKELLTVADNLSRALLAAPAPAREENVPLRTLAVGVEMTEKGLLNVLEKYGVVKIDSLNQPFDPHVHQAMQEVERTDVPNATVVQVHLDAYRIDERLLRPAMVIVSKGGPKRESPASNTAPEDAEPGVDASV